MFAIGAYYEHIALTDDERGASTPQESHQHVRYINIAIAITQKNTSKHTIDHISALLVQCFYLLATCQTDRCWIKLGLAVRIAQSVGLHVDEGYCVGQENVQENRETCRRVWFSIFVLDRLLALQLGRPPAISGQGFNVKSPSSTRVIRPEPGNTHLPDCRGDYFLAMIEFSQIIGRVFDSLYGPRKADNTESILSNVDRLDGELLRWRSTLPRVLRFDLSHTFEKSTIYKSQVCMAPGWDVESGGMTLNRSVTCLPSSSTISRR